MVATASASVSRWFIAAVREGSESSTRSSKAMRRTRLPARERRPDGCPRHRPPTAAGRRCPVTRINVDR